MEKLLKDEDLNFDQMNLEEMDVYWNKAKNIINNLE